MAEWILATPRGRMMMKSDSVRIIDAAIARAPLWRRIRWHWTMWWIQRARNYLFTHDPDYRIFVRLNELNERRNVARQNGIGPGDEDYPVLELDDGDMDLFRREIIDPLKE
jgi:hypothetical protein